MKSGSTLESGDSGILSSPLSFLRSSYFNWDGAGLGGRGSSGRYWSLRSDSTTYSNRLYFDGTSLYPRDIDNRGNGFSVRCTQILHHSH